jgi:hypothetical protein
MSVVRLNMSHGDHASHKVRPAAPEQWLASKHPGTLAHERTHGAGSGSLTAAVI